MGVLISLLVSPIALADPPPDPKEQSVPVQLTLIRDYLVEMEGRLSQQMTDMEGRMSAAIADVQSSVDVGNGKLDVLQVTANDIYGVVTEVNIDLTTTYCFGGDAKWESMVGIHDEVGIGWPNVLSAKAIAQGETALVGEIAGSSEICVEIPLYSVESYNQLFTNGGEFDALIAALALPSQSVVPIIAEVYTELMPSPDEALEAMNNVSVASTGWNLYTGAFGSPNHAALLRPDILLEPVIPHAALDFLAQVPGALEAALLDPCGTLEDTPIGMALEGRDDIEFLCDAHAGFLWGIAEVVDWIWGGIEWLVDLFTI
jgi:hypothetical protein